MRLGLAVVWAGIIAIGGAGNSCSTTPARQSSETSIEELASGAELGQIVDALAVPVVRARHAEGMVIGVVTPFGDRVFSYRSVSPYTSHSRLDGDSVFQVGSVSKVFTTTLLADLAAEGKVSLESPIGSLLPADFHPASEEVAKISFAQLASHSSGLPREPMDPSMLRSLFRYSFTGRNLYEHLTERRILDFMRGYRLDQAGYHPYHYSNLGVALLGWLLAQEEHEDFNQLVTRKILVPLGLTDTGYSLSAEQNSRLAIGHAGDIPWFLPRNTPVEPWEVNEGMRPTGGVYSTANDLMKFVRANLGLAPAPGELPRAFELARRRLNSTRKGAVALGWFVEQLPNAKHEFVYSDGITSGHTSFIGFDEESKIGVVVLLDSINFDDQIGETLLDRLVAAQDRAPGKPLALGAVTERHVNVDREDTEGAGRRVPGEHLAR